MNELKQALAQTTIAGTHDMPIYQTCEFIDEKLVERSVEHLWYVVEDSQTGLEIIDADSEEWFHGRTPLKVLYMFGDPKLPICWQV
jgi:hypothetical protein